MQFAWLIAAHDKGDQLIALLDRLLPAGTPDYAVLHLDRKSPLWLDERDRFAQHPSGRVLLVENPARVEWGHHSQLAATLKMLTIANQKGFDLAHHLSGSDWPVAARARMVAGAAAHPRTAFIEIVGPEQGERMQSWWFDRTPVPSPARFAYRVGRIQSQFSRAFTGLANRLGFQRSQPYGAPWLKGWSWWSLPHDMTVPLAAELATLLKSGRLRFTQCCDEHVIPTFVARTWPDRLAPFHRYIVWPEDCYHPDTLTDADSDAIQTSGAWFARKCDSGVDPFFLGAFEPFI